MPRDSKRGEREVWRTWVWGERDGRTMPAGFVLPEDGKPLPAIGRGLVALLESLDITPRWEVAILPPAAGVIDWTEVE